MNGLENNLDGFAAQLLFVVAGAACLVIGVGIAVVVAQDRRRAARRRARIPAAPRVVADHRCECCSLYPAMTVVTRAVTGERERVCGGCLDEGMARGWWALGWFANNYEGHRPTAAPFGASGRWVPACHDGCIDPLDDGVLTHYGRGDAVAQAAHILAGRIHGPSDRETSR
jgi:hypothetical protein